MASELQVTPIPYERIIFQMNEQNSSLDIRLPELFALTDEHDDIHSLTCQETLVELRHCTLDSLDAAGDVYLRNCRIRTVKAVGNIFCRSCPKLNQVTAQGDVCMLNCRDVQLIKGTRLFIDSSDSLKADLISQTGHVYFLCKRQLQYNLLGKEGPKSAFFIPMSNVTVSSVERMWIPPDIEHSESFPHASHNPSDQN